MSHFDLRCCKAIPDLPSRNVFYTLAALDYFFSYFNWIIYPPAILPCSKNWEKAHKDRHFWLGKEVDDDARATLRFPLKIDLFPFFRSYFKRSEEGWNPHNEHFKIIESQIDE